MLTTVVPKRLLDTIKSFPKVYSVGRRFRFGIGSLLGARTVPGIRGPVHFNDFMLYKTDVDEAEWYATSARDFVGILGRSLEEAGRSWADVNAVLEIGCGYGRIVRELRSQQSHVDIFVNDAIDEGARFTARAFSARRIPLLEDAVDPLLNRFDLVYLLSVYTHMPREFVARNIALVAAALRPGGVVVFTVHGESSAQMIEGYRLRWLDPHSVLETIAQEGYYYQRYPYYKDECGLSWFAADAIRGLVSTAAPALQLLSYHAMELDEHQDIYVYQRAG